MKKTKKKINETASCPQTVRSYRNGYPLQDEAFRCGGVSSLWEWIVSVTGASYKVEGDNVKMACPMPGHTEKDASFCISKSKNIYYCFGNCRASIKGGAFLDFIVGFYNLRDKREVKEKLASLYPESKMLSDG